MVFLQGAARETGPSAACLQEVREGHLELVLSPEVLAEVRDVLTRPKVQQKFSALTPANVEVFLRDLEKRALKWAEVPRAFSLERDPKDEKYVDLAIASGAQHLVSWDKDLLDLMNDESFRQRFPSLTILDPVALLQELALERQGTGEQGPSC
jgi:putative PIN family toxin of toxin-antitoxin system